MEKTNQLAKQHVDLSPAKVLQNRMLRTKLPKKDIQVKNINIYVKEKIIIQN